MIGCQIKRYSLMEGARGRWSSGHSHCESDGNGQAKTISMTNLDWSLELL